MLAKRGRTPLPVSFVIADIDHFKKVNDNYGHQVGDEVIASFGQLMGGSARESDCACPMGGEEFGALLWNCDRADAALFAEGLRTACQSHSIDALPGNTRFTASFGVAEANASDNFDDLYGCADAALYEAKNAGRNCVVSERDFENVVPPPKAVC
ncbi:MAG: GGDEF domain-containing protein [Pseudomonadota bacterium]